MILDNERENVRGSTVIIDTLYAPPANDCWWCRQASYCKCIDWRDIKIQKLILPSDEVIKHPIFYAGLAMASKATGKSRREFISYMTNILYRDNHKFYESDGVTEFKLLLCSVYTAFNDDEDFRWISYFMETTIESRKIKASDKLLPRLKLIVYTFMVVDFGLIKRLEHEVLEDIRKKQSSKKIQMIWCASFSEKNRRYDLDAFNNGEAEVSVYENNVLEGRIRLQNVPDRWDIGVAKCLNLIK